MIDADWHRIESQKEILDHSIEYFSDLLGGTVVQPSFIQSDLDLILQFHCTEDQ